MPTALAYVRRSKNSKKRPSASPERQASNIEELAGTKHWTVEWFRDTEGHKSGLNESRRPAWLELKARIERSRPGEITAVIVNSLDRSSRKTKDFLNFLDLCQGKRVDFISATQLYLDTTTPYGRAMVANMMIFAQLEAEIDSQRVSEDIEFRQSEGVMWGPAPFGYTPIVLPVDGQRFKVRSPDDDAPLVKRLLETYSHGDVSMRALARSANLWPAAHIPGGFWRMRRRDGSRSPFTHRSIESIIDNARVYAGQVERYAGKDGAETYDGKHEPIIDSATADAILAAREARTDKVLVSGRLNVPRVYLLTGLLHCAICGQRYRGQYLNGRARYWHGVGSHGTARVDTAILDRNVLDRFGAAWLDLPPDHVQTLAALPRDRVPDGDDTARQVAELRARLAREKDLYVLGDRTREEYTARRTDLEAQIARLAPPPERVHALTSIATVAAQLRDVALSLGDAPPARQRALLHLLFERIDTDGKQITRLITRPWMAEYLNRVIDVYPQPASSGHLDHILDCAAIDTGSWVDRCADRNATMRARRRGGALLRELAAEFGLSIERARQIVMR